MTMHAVGIRKATTILKCVFRNGNLISRLSANGNFAGSSRSIANDCILVTGNNFQPLMISYKRYEKYKQKLQDFGFSCLQADKILKSEPDVLSVKLENLSSCLLNWYALKLSEEDLFQSLSAYPKLLLLSEDEVGKRMKELLSVFAQKDIFKLLKTAPEVFIHNFETITEKVQYIVHCMGIEQDNIVTAKALKFDLMYIRLRHKFLVATGKYKKASKKNVMTEVPSLKEILHTDIQIYLNLSGCTEEEYNVFCDIYTDLFEDDVNEDENDF